MTQPTALVIVDVQNDHFSGDKTELVELENTAQNCASENAAGCRNYTVGDLWDNDPYVYRHNHPRRFRSGL